MEKVQREILRACMALGSISREQLDDKLAEACARHGVGKPKDADEVQELINGISSKISRFDEAVTFIKHPVSGKEYLVHTSTSGAPSAIQCPHPSFTEPECKYFTILIDKIAKAEGFNITWNEAITNIEFPNSAKPPLMSRMQELATIWCNVGYFLEHNQKIYFGPRCLVELEFYLRSNFVDTIKDCTLCKKLVLWGVQCSDCNAKVHRDCIHKYLRTCSNCPVCNEKWSTSLICTNDK